MNEEDFNKKEGTLYFEMNVDTAERFFELCRDRKADTEEERLKILGELAEEQKINRIGFCAKTKEEFVDDLSKRFNVLYLNSKENPDGKKD